MTSSVATTRVVRPNQGEQGMGAGALSGAAAGAAAGSAILPGWGTVIGGVVGGIAGAVSGAFMDKGKVYERMARKYSRQGKEREAAIQIRDQLRAFRMQRANALVMGYSDAGGSQSTAPVGGISAMGNQYAFGTNYTDAQMYLARQSEKFTNKAGNAYNTAKMGFAMIDAGASIAGAFGGGGAGGSPFGSSTSSGGAPASPFGTGSGGGNVPTSSNRMYG